LEEDNIIPDIILKDIGTIG